MTGLPLLLGSRATRACPLAVHRAQAAGGPGEGGEERGLAVHLAHVAEIFAAIEAQRGDAVRIPNGGDPVAATEAAMAAGAPLILGAQLPPDPVGHREGRADLLVRADDGAGAAAYVPGVVTRRSLLERVDPAREAAAPTPRRLGRDVAPWHDPLDRATLPDAALRGRTPERLALRLVHLTRLLQACGRAADPTWGFALGGDDLARWGAAGAVGVWLPLDEPLFETYSRSAPGHRRVRTAEERYAHEFGFRVDVALAARRGEEPGVVPVFGDECRGCATYAECAPTFETHPSAVLSAVHLRVPEWLALARLGVHTVADVAAVDPTPEWFETYAAETLVDEWAAARLVQAVERARLVQSGLALAVRPGETPRADIEIDLDMENDAEGFVYLWGARLRRGGDEATATYTPFVDWGEMTPEAEVAVAEALVAWLVDVRAEAERTGRSVLIFHHHSVERTMLARILSPAVFDRIGLDFCDTLKLAQRRLVSVHGHGLKVLATSLGFAWRDPEPGGLNSQRWLRDARAAHGPEQAALRRRVLDYNEDDTAATAWLRDHLDDAPPWAAATR